MNISRVHHIGVYVNDLEQALKLYRDGLGLPVVYQQPRMAMVSAGENHIELIEPAADAPVRQQPQEQWEGSNHVALETDNIAAALAELQAKGAPLRGTEPRALPNYKFAFLAAEALDGASVELVETTKAYDPIPDHPYIKGFDHIVISQPDLAEATRKWDEYLGLYTRREMNRTMTTRLAFLKSGRCILELAGPRSDVPPGERRPGRIGGFVFEVAGIDSVQARLKEQGLPAGDVHTAVQGGRIFSVHRSATSGVPLAFIEYDGTAPAGTGLQD
jgi:catechol 2,3-dioxygenase-like lactoylglutathione lyase family enzyme